LCGGVAGGVVERRVVWCEGRVVLRLRGGWCGVRGGWCGRGAGCVVEGRVVLQLRGGWWCDGWAGVLEGSLLKRFGEAVGNNMI